MQRRATSRTMIGSIDDTSRKGLTISNRLFRSTQLRLRPVQHTVVQIKREVKLSSLKGLTHSTVCAVCRTVKTQRDWSKTKYLKWQTAQTQMSLLIIAHLDLSVCLFNTIQLERNNCCKFSNVNFVKSCFIILFFFVLEGLGTY